jgi:hypothetical protein
MSDHNCGCKLSESEDNAVSVLLEQGLNDDIVSKALEAAQQVIKDAGLSEKLYVASVEISEMPTDVVAEVEAKNCGYRRVCDRSERVCDWYVDAQGNRWRRCYTRPVCRMVPNC